MKWQFIPQPACFVEQGVTQRDQFRNDEVDLFETIVRESVQNSLDATVNKGQTFVKFSWITKDDGLSGEYLKEIFKEQITHAECAGLDLSEVNFNSPSALIIEDFGTKGLSGSIDKKDNDNFSDFWRRHGKSHKTGTSRGRWGLGKLVYSSASNIGAFFGLTKRENDDCSYLMGQTVLDLRECEGIEYPAHAYFSEITGDDLNTWFPIPSSDNEYISQFKTQFSLTRKNEPGLSICIPFPTDSIKPNNVIAVSIANYFYPIITKQLKLDINGQEITADNIRPLAHKYASSKVTEIDELFDFIEEVNTSISNKKIISLKESWADDIRLSEDDFEETELDLIQSTFNKGETVGVRLPLSIKKKSKEILQTEFYVFVKRPENISKGQDLYVRGGLTLPSESKFGERKAFGLMVADEEVISAFLGDAENPAHTRWVYHAEKLRQNYINPNDKLKIIKRSLLQFHDMLTQEEEEQDDSALVNFFFTEVPDLPDITPKEKVETPPSPDDIVIEKKPKIAQISNTNGGFSISPGVGAETFKFPQYFKVRAAYDIPKGNPFKNHSPLDFDFNKRGISISKTAKTVNVIEKKENEFTFMVLSPQYQIKIDGFDPNRDIVVKLKTETVEDY